MPWFHVSPLKIRDAMPGIFQRSYPLLDPRTEMISAMSLLRFHEIDALPLSFDAMRRDADQVRAVFGYSSLARLILLDPRQFAAFLTRPCHEASDPLAVVSSRSSLARLLDTFAKTRFGFARIESGRDAGALAGLYDVLGLYGGGAVASDLVLDDVGSRILALPEETTLREALEVMFERRYRRAFIGGSRRFISDRGIIGHVFSPDVLTAISKDGGDVLSAPISSLETTTAKESSADLTLKEAAAALRSERAGQCLVFGDKVATPWDLVMKPWEENALKVGRSR